MIQVLDQNKRPVEGAAVHVSWRSSHSSRNTDSSGNADLGTSGGAANYITVNGKQVQGAIQLDGGVFTVYVER